MAEATLPPPPDITNYDTDSENSSIASSSSAMQFEDVLTLEDAERIIKEETLEKARSILRQRRLASRAHSFSAEQEEQEEQEGREPEIMEFPRSRSQSQSLPPLYPSQQQSKNWWKVGLFAILVLGFVFAFPTQAGMFVSGLGHLIGIGGEEKQSGPLYLPLHTKNLVITTRSYALPLSKEEILSESLITDCSYDVAYLRRSMRHQMTSNGNLSSICAVHFKVPVSYCIVLHNDNKTLIEMFNVEIESLSEPKFLHEETSIYCPNEYFIERSIRIRVRYMDEYGDRVNGQFDGGVAGIIQANCDLNRGLLPCSLGI